jgi:multiple sugar transport system permease protein
VNVKKRRLNPSRVAWRTVMYVVLILLSLFCLLPLGWMVRSSFMKSTQIVQVRPFILWPDTLLWKNYLDALQFVPFLRYFMNTMIILGGVLLGTVTTSTLAAYSFSRVRWRGRDVIFGILMSSMMLPGAVTLIPTYLAWGALGRVNTFWPLVLPSFFGGGIFNIFLLRQFYNSIPMELDEAAFVDGASNLQIYARIIVPLSRPAIVVVMLFTFLGVWNDYFGPIIYLNDPKKFTLAIGLLQFRASIPPSGTWSWLRPRWSSSLPDRVPVRSEAADRRHFPDGPEGVTPARRFSGRAGAPHPDFWRDNDEIRSFDAGAFSPGNAGKRLLVAPHGRHPPGNHPLLPQTLRGNGADRQLPARGRAGSWRLRRHLF